MGSPRTRTATRRPAKPVVASYTPVVPGEPKLLHVLERRPVEQDGVTTYVEVTRKDKILSYLRSNAPFHVAAQAAGVHKRTLTQWLRDGAEAQAKAEAIRSGNGEGARLSKREKVLVEFIAEVDQIMAERQVRLAGKLTQLAEGGIAETTITEKVEFINGTENGVPVVHERLVERNSKTVTKAPSLPAIVTLLERRYGDDGWERTDKVQLSGGLSGGSAVTAESVGMILDSIAEKVEKRIADKATVDADSTEDVVDAEVIDGEGTELEVAARPE